MFLNKTSLSLAKDIHVLGFPYMFDRTGLDIAQGMQPHTVD